MNKTKLVFIFITLFCTINAGQILPGSQFPVLLGNPHADSATADSIVFEFSLDSDLVAGNFVAVEFPKTQATVDLGGTVFKFDTDAFSSCSFNKDAATTISGTWTKSATTQNNIHYCRVEDVLSKGQTYRMNVGLSNPATHKNAATTWGNINIFTISAASSIGIIKHAGAGFGNLVIFKASNTGENEIISQSADPTSSLTTINFYDSHDVTVKIKVKAITRAQGSVLAVTFPDSTIVATLPTSVDFTDIDTQVALKKKLTGTPKIVTDGTTLYVSGWTDDWWPTDREFGLVFKGIKAGESSGAGNLIVRYYYTNSNVVQSYSTKSFPKSTALSVKTFTAAHNEGWDIYMSGAWPIKFVYEFDKAFAPTGGAFVAIFHSNYFWGSNVFNFVASTCDFSATSDFSKDFNARNDCFPVQPSDLQFTVTALAGTEWAGKLAGTVGTGSGIFFKQDKFDAKQYTFVVWGVADLCGLISPLNAADPAIADPLTDNSSGMSVDVKFTIRIYKTVDQTKRSGSFFTGALELVTAKETTAQPKCYSVYRGMEQDKTAIDITQGFGWELYSILGDGYGKTKAIQLATAGSTNTDLITTNKYDSLFYKEFTDPVIMTGPDTEPTGTPTALYYLNLAMDGLDGSVNSNYLKTGYGLVSNDAKKGGIQPLFLYSDTSDNVASGKNVLIRGDFTTTTLVQTAEVKTTTHVGLPSPIIDCTQVTTNSVTFAKTWAQAGGALEIYFSTNWFEAFKADTTCGISWQVSSTPETTDSGTLGVLTITKMKMNKTPGTTTKDVMSGVLYGLFPVDILATPAADKEYIFSDFTLKSFSDGNGLDATKRADQMTNYYLSKAGTTPNLDSLTVSATSIVFKSKNQSGGTSVGGKFFTVNPSALSYKLRTDISNLSEPILGYECKKGDAAAKTICNFSFNLYTNCLKWKATITDKTLYSYVDVIYRFMPNISSTVKSVPNRVIRFIKLFPEAQGFHDVLKRKFNTSSPITIHHAPAAPESLTGANNIISQGAVCLVQISYAGIGSIITANTNAIAIFLFNLPLLNVDASDAAATYPVGSLDGAVAYGLNSAPTVSVASYLGGPSMASAEIANAGNWVNGQSVNLGLSGLYRISQKPNNTANIAYKADTYVSLSTLGALRWSQARSNYLFLMGSVVLITGVKASTNPLKNTTVTNGQIDMYIPTRCTPISNKHSPVADDKALLSSVFDIPTAYVVSLKATNFAQFDNVTAVMTTGTSTDVTLDSYSIHQVVKTKISPATSALTKNTKLQVYYLNYADNTSNAANIFAVESQDTATTTATVSSFTVFASDVLKADAKGVGAKTTSIADNGTVMAQYTSTKPIFVYGHKYYQFYAKAVDNVFDNAGKKVSFYGLTRPATLADFKATATTISSGNLLLVVGQPKGTDASISIKHLITNVTSNADGTFSVGGAIYKYEITSGSDLGNLKVEAYDKMYKSDKALGLKLTFSLGAKYTAYPSQSSFVVTTISSLLGGAPICAIANATGKPTDCTVAGDVLTCVSGSARSGDVVVCCYSLTATVSGKADKVTLQATGITTDDSGNIVISNPTDVVSPYTDSADDISTKVATLSAPVYYPAQELGLGRVTLTSTLPRIFVRDGKIVFEGTFPFVTSNTPKTAINCEFYFGNAMDDLNGNALVESCDLSNFDTTSNSIVVITRKYIYQCGYAFSATINFVLYPVELGKIDITKKFKIKGLAPGGSSASNELFASTDIDYSANDSYFKGLAAKPAVAFIKDKLCSLTYAGVYPRIPGGLTDFTFDFDLKSDTVKPALDQKTINRFTIWFPKYYFNSFANSQIADQFCTVGGKQVQCKFINPTQLVVRTSASFGTNLSITVTGVRVGWFDTNLSFYCSVDNESDANAGTHTNLLTGSGLMAAADPSDSGITGIQQVAVAANVWNLRLLTNNNAGMISLDEPRGKSNLTLRAVVDQHSAWISQSDVQIKGTPTVHVYLPSEFTQNWYRWTDTAGYKPNMKINNVTGVVTDGKVVLTSTPLDLSGTTFSSNRISGTLKADLVLTNNHKYLEIIIEGIRNPLTPVSTGLFNIAIASAKYDYLLRSFYNAYAGGNTDYALAYTLMPAPTATGSSLVSTIYTLQRGITVKGAAKWDSNINGNNLCTSNAGKYSPQTFNVVGTGLTQVVASLKLTDANSLFSFPPNTDYQLKTADGKIAFKLGAKCGSVNGSYLLTVAASSDSFYGGAICYTSLTSVKSTIKFAFDGGANTCIKGGSLPASYTLPEANVDEIKIDKWTGDTANDATSSIAAVTIPANTLTVPAVFSITNDAISTIQKFTLTFTNACWSVDPTSTDVTPSIAAPAIDTADPKPWIKCTDPASDATLKDRLNSVHCSVTPTLFPLNMFSAVVCKTAAAPADTQIMAVKLDNTNTFLNQVAKYYFSKSETYELYFTGLARGQSYKVIFIFQTTEADATKRKTKSITIDSIADPKDATKTIDIKTPAVDGTVCMTFVFQSAITSVIKRAILEGLQNNYFPSGSAGCIILTYNDTVDGKPTPQYVAGYAPKDNSLVTCPAASSKLRNLSNKRLLSMPASTTPPTTPSTTPSSSPSTPAAPTPTFPHSICAMQNIVCGNVVSTSRRLRDLATVPPASTPAATPPAPAPASNLLTKINSVQTSVNTPAKLAAVSNNNDISKLTFTVQVVSDSSAPTVTVTVSGTYDASAKKVNVVINFTDTTQLNCYYQISASGTAPTFDNVQKCTTANVCGNFTLQSPSVTISADISSLAIGTAYSVWYSCFNNVPNAVNGSATKSAYDFTTSCPTGTTLTNGSCQAPTTTPTPSTSTNSNFVTMSIALIVALIMLI